VSWLPCLCGCHATDVMFPQPGKAYLVQDDDLDGATDYGTKPAVVEAGVPKREVFLCRECGRLLVEVMPGSGRFANYRPETGADRLKMTYRGDS